MYKILHALLILLFFSSASFSNNFNNESTVSKTAIDKNDRSIPLYLRYGYTDSLQFIRDQLALNAYPYEKVVDYKWGGNTQQGWDCSGFIKYMYAQFNIAMPRTAAEMSKLGVSISFNDLITGDLLFFGTGTSVTHVAMIFNSTDGTKKIIHCASSSGVTINSFDDSTWKNYWSKRYLFSKRIVV